MTSPWVMSCRERGKPQSVSTLIHSWPKVGKFHGSGDEPNAQGKKGT